MKKIIIFFISTFFAILLISFSILGISALDILSRDLTPIINFLFPLIILLIIFIPIFILLEFNFKKTKLEYKNPINVYENSTPEFEKLYDTLYNNFIYKLEYLRKKVKFMLVLKLCALFAFLLLEAYEDSAFSETVFYPIIALIAFIIFFLPFNSKDDKAYTSMYKKNIISEFIKLLNNNLSYTPEIIDSSSIEKDYSNASFDTLEYNNFFADDYLEGFLDDSTFLNLSDLRIEHTYYNGSEKKTVTRFSGIFAYTNCTKDIGTFIKISLDKLNSINKSDQDYRVELDNSEFEKHFEVYSENKIFAVRLLTADIMQNLMEFYNKFNINFEIVFSMNNIYLRFFTGSMFEPKIFGSSMDKQLLYEYYCILQFILEVTKKINSTLNELEI